MLADRRAAHEDRRQGPHRAHNFLARVEALNELRGHQRQVTRHLILRDTSDSREEVTGVKAVRRIHDLRVRLRDGRAQKNHRAGNVMRRQRQNPASRAAQRQLGRLQRGHERIHRQTDQARLTRAGPRRRNDQVHAVEEMWIVLDLIGEAGVVLLRERLLRRRRRPAQRSGRNPGGIAQEDNGVRRGVVWIGLALLVELDQLMNRRVSQGNGANCRPTRDDKNSRRSHDVPPKIDSERRYYKDKRLCCCWWRAASRQSSRLVNNFLIFRLLSCGILRN